MLPKFDPMVGVARSVNTSATSDSPCDLLVEPDANDKNDGNSAAKKVNNSGQPQGSDLARPIGIKKAKKMEKVRSSSKASVDPSARTGGVVANELLVDMSAATKDLVASFKAFSSMKHEYLTARKHNKWMRMADMYTACGQKEKALDLLPKVQQDDKSFFTTSNSVNNSEVPSAIKVGDTTSTTGKGKSVDDEEEDLVVLEL